MIILDYSKVVDCMERNRIYSLDLLKFIVSIIIVIHHLQLETDIGLDVIDFAYGQYPIKYVTEIFFIISGFLSMFHFSTDEQNEVIIKKDFPSFFKHICIRIYPITILSIVFTLFCGVLYRLVKGNWWHNCVPSLWRFF